MSGPDRRRFLAQALGGAALLSTPSLARGATGEPGYPWTLLLRGAGASGGVPAGPPPSPTDEPYWRQVKEQFPLAPGLVLLNAANLCPSPYQVQEAVFACTRDVDRDPSFQNREKYGGLKEEARAALAAYVGASPDEIAITRNTSEGNNAVVNGLDLGPGDEVVIWDQNHPTNNVSWDVRAQRWGYTVRRVSTPPGARNAGELAEPFLRALTPRTRVLAFSHLSNVSGTLLPAGELCRAARERGVLTLVDGAQTFGALALDLPALGCDFFTGSSHKWLMGPKEAGLMYVRAGSMDRLWPSDVGVGWEGAVARGAQKFDNLGQRDDAAVVSMATAAAFHQALGPGAVDERVRYLGSAAMEALRSRFAEVRLHTPAFPQARGGVVVFSLPGADHDALYQAVYRTHRVACAAMHGEFEGIRFSPHIYNTLDDVEAAIAAVAAHA